MVVFAEYVGGGGGHVGLTGRFIVPVSFSEEIYVGFVVGGVMGHYHGVEDGADPQSLLFLIMLYFSETAQLDARLFLKIVSASV